MQKYPDFGPCPRPLCFQPPRFEIGTFSKTQEYSTVNKEDSFSFTLMDNVSAVNKASPGDHFARHGLAVLFDNAAQKKEQDKIRIRKQLRQVSLDTLATEWLNMEPRTIENRAYLIGSVLPQVVFGLEHILKEAVDRGLTGLEQTEQARLSDGADPNFNPINRLAEFLMRNNHKYSNFSETSPYIRGLRNAVAQLQHEMFMRSDNHLARLKAAVIKTKEERIKLAEAEAEEQQRRRRVITEVFEKFLVRDRKTVESSVIHNSIRTFLDLGAKLPEPLKQSFVPLYEIKVAEEPPSSYNQEEFVIYVMLYATSLSSEVFDELAEHLKLCAEEYVSALQRDQRRNVFTKFFASCNVSQIEGVSRDKMFNLCDNYFESAPADTRSLLRDPKDWPVQDYFLRVTLPELELAEVQQQEEALQKAENEEENEFTEDKNNSAACCLMETPYDVTRAELNGRRFSGEDLSADHLDEQQRYMKSSSMNTPIHEVSGILKSLSATLPFINGSQCTYSKRQYEFGYMPYRLTLAQFLHMMESFVTKDAPDEVVHEFVSYLERNYEDSPEWRESYVKQFKKMEFEEAVNEIIADLFHYMDYKSKGFIDLSLVEQYIARFEDASMEALKQAKRDVHTILKIPAKDYCSCMNQTGLWTDQTNLDKIDQLDLQPDTLESTALSDRSGAAMNLLIDKPNFRVLLRHTFSIGINHRESQKETMEKLSRFSEFVKQQMKVCEQDRLKGSVRRNWLESIEYEARFAHHSMEPVYRATFKAILRNTLEFGVNKPMSVNVYLIQSGPSSPNKPTDPDSTPMLRCVAAIPEADAVSLVGSEIPSSHADTSYQALKYGSIMYDNGTRDSQWFGTEYKNSTSQSGKEPSTDSSIRTRDPRYQPVSLAVPIPNELYQNRGVLLVQKMTVADEDTVFQADELDFYQAIANKLGQALATVNQNKIFAQTVVAAFQWITQYLDTVEQMEFYCCLDMDEAKHTTVQVAHASDDDEEKIDRLSIQQRNCALARLVTKPYSAASVIHTKPQVIEHSNSFLKNYLFTVVDTAEVVEHTSCGTRHFCYPVRDCEGVTVGVVDLSTTENHKLSTKETHQVNIMMAILSAVRSSLLQNKMPGNWVTPEDTVAFSPSSLFRQLATAELHKLGHKLASDVSKQLYDHLNSSPVSLEMVHMIAKILGSNSEDKNGSMDDIHNLCAWIEKLLPWFNPISAVNENILTDLHDFFKRYPATKVKHQIPQPIQPFYQWLRCCTSMLELSISNTQ